MAAPLSLHQSDRLLAGGFDVEGSQANDARLALKRDFPHLPRSRLAIVVVPRADADIGARRAAVTHVALVVAENDDVRLSTQALLDAKREAANAQSALLPLDVQVDEDRSQEVAAELYDELGRHPGADLYLVGEGALKDGADRLAKEDLKDAELVGFPAVLLLLLGVFGALAPAALPLALAVCSLVVTGAVVFLLSHAVDMSVYVTNIASLVGIGVAVDYSLFVLSRYRDEIAAGRSSRVALSVALSTAGVAVAFSGLTVLVSLAGLFLTSSTVISSMAIGAMIVVAVSVLASLTLLPVLILLMGRRLHSRWRPLDHIRPKPAATPTRSQGRHWLKLVAVVVRRPRLATAIGAAIMLTLSFPLLDVRLGQGFLNMFPEGHEARAGVSEAAKLSPPGTLTPVQVVVPVRRASTDGRSKAALASLARDVRAERGVREVSRAVPSPAGRSFLLTVTLRADGESEEARRTVTRIRDAAARHSSGLLGPISVGGVTAEQLDFGRNVEESLPRIAAFIVLASFALLVVLLRSVVLPLQAVALNLLSVTAALGVVVAVFQWGWLEALTGIRPVGQVDPVTPPLVLAIVFGLSMDYEVFLLTRVRERYEQSGNWRAAIQEGVAASAGTIVSAALIMIAVFTVFVSTGVPAVQEVGLGLAIAVALDATLGRLVLIPATMTVLGRRSWWLPRPLERVLPRVPSAQVPDPLAGELAPAGPGG